MLATLKKKSADDSCPGKWAKIATKKATVSASRDTVSLLGRFTRLERQILNEQGNSGRGELVGIQIFCCIR